MARIAIDRGIMMLINRPASIGHIGEFIASQIFRNTLEESAVSKGYDRDFIDGPLTGKTANVTFYRKGASVRGVNSGGIPDTTSFCPDPRPTR